MQDHNTRIIVFGRDSKQASEVAEALARETFHTVTYFSGTSEALKPLINKGFLIVSADSRRSGPYELDSI